MDWYTPSVLAELPRSWFGELSGEPVMLFVGQPSGWTASSTLYCFDAKGRERWRFVPGKPLQNVVGERFVNKYGIAAFMVGPVGPKGSLGIVVTSYHYLYAPSQVVLLNTDGKLVREYWHAGHLGHLGIGDPGGTGQQRIFLGGINNARHSATLVVLDPDHFGGAATEDDPSHHYVGLGSGRELARVFFPRSCMNRQLESYNGVANLWVHPGAITVDVHERYGLARTPGVLYELSPQLTVRTVTLGDAFLPHHALLHKNGDLDHAFSAAELDNFHQLTFVRPVTQE